MNGTAFKNLSGKTRLVQVLVVLALSVSVYVNALWNGFVWDDLDQVISNAWIRDAGSIPAILKMNVWGFRGQMSNYYRPVMHLIYMFDYHLFGLSPWGFHLINILLHAAASLLVFMVTERLFPYKETGHRAVLSIPFMTAVIFAVHPIHTEPVDWIAGLPDLSYALFFLASFYFYTVSWREDGKANKWAISLSAALFLMAMLSKEPAVVLPAVLLVYDHVVKKNGYRLKEYFRRYLPYLLAVCIYFVARYMALGEFTPNKPHVKLSPYREVINIFPLFRDYLEKLVLPLNLNAFYVFHPASSVFETRVLSSIIVTALFAAALSLSLKKRSPASIGLVIIASTLLPVLYIRAIGENVFGERYLYLPVFGFGLLLSLLISRLAASRPPLSKALASCFIGLTVLYSAGTITRNPVWKDNYILWSDTVKKSPDGSLVHNCLGAALFDKGFIDEAIVEHKKAIQLDYNQYLAHLSLTSAYIKKGMMAQALEECIIALSLEQGDERIYGNLGTIYAEMGQMDNAVKALREAVTINPYDVVARTNLGVAYRRMGNMDQSIEELQDAVRINPENVDAHFNLGLSYRESGKLKEASEQFETVLKIDPNNAQSRAIVYEILHNQ